METVLKNESYIDDAVISVIDKKLLEAEELEARGGKYYTQAEIDEHFKKFTLSSCSFKGTKCN